jgi:predicted amino acid racemase
MAFVTLNRKHLQQNFNYLETLFQSRNIEWGAVSKLLCGNKLYLKELLRLGIREIHDSRISNLKLVKQLNKDVQTVYIKPPAKRSIRSIVQYADVSLNTELETIRMLSKEAVLQGKLHKVIIMIELGDLREGVMGEDLIDFYENVFELPGIKVVGLGSNLNCLSGVMPSEDKLIQLSLYKQLIEAKFNRQIPYVSGGTSVVLPLLLEHRRPSGVNHFRIGETLFFGVNLFNEKTIPGMRNDVFKLYVEIIELTEKPIVPVGELATNPSGEKLEINEEDYGKRAFRAIVDIGLLDISPKFLTPDDDSIEIIGASSDMLILDLHEHHSNYKVGDLISFEMTYMGALGIMNSNYVEKKIIGLESDPG